MMAPRERLPAWQLLARGAVSALCLWAAGSGAWAQTTFTRADYAEPTGEYAHGVLGDALEWKALQVHLSDGTQARIAAGSQQVFEDIAPRLWDVTGDGAPEVVSVRSHQMHGAQLVIFGIENGALSIIAQTPHIGTRFRWLAPVGAADLDGDGAIEIGYVDRPHLAKTLRIWRYREGNFQQVAALRGVTNHRIGEDFISGGLRNCGEGPEFILADTNWQSVVSVSFDGTAAEADRIARFRGPTSFQQALNCQ